MLGNAFLDDSLLNPPPRFMQDAIQKDQYRIYEKGRIRPATRDECNGLKPAPATQSRTAAQAWPPYT